MARAAFSARSCEREVRGEGHIGTLLGKKRRRPHADRPRARQHDRLFALELPSLGEQRHAGRRRSVGAIGIEHDGDAERAEEALLHRFKQRLALRYVAAADEDRGRLLVLAAAGKDGAVDQRADIVRRDTGIAGDPVGAAVIGDDSIEHARIGIGVEQEQQFLHEGLPLRTYSTTFCGFPATNASTLSMS
jgi:hypothetical protein